MKVPADLDVSSECRHFHVRELALIPDKTSPHISDRNYSKTTVSKLCSSSVMSQLFASD